MNLCVYARPHQCFGTQVWFKKTIPSIMWEHNELNQSLFNLIRNEKIMYAGNAKLKIYGTLHCHSGKRMKKENRVFFKDEAEAINQGFRPCKNCLRKRVFGPGSH